MRKTLLDALLLFLVISGISMYFALPALFLVYCHETYGWWTLGWFASVIFLNCYVEVQQWAKPSTNSI